MDGESGHDDGFKVAARQVELEHEGARKLATVDGRYVAIMRHKESLYALDATCYHMGGPLLLGDIEDVAGIGPCLTCPWHHYQIALQGGERVYQDLHRNHCTIPRRQRTHRVAEGDGAVYVKLNDSDHQFESDRYAHTEPPPAQRCQKSRPGVPATSGDVLRRAREKRRLNRFP